MFEVMAQAGDSAHAHEPKTPTNNNIVGAYNMNGGLGVGLALTNTIPSPEPGAKSPALPPPHATQASLRPPTPPSAATTATTPVSPSAVTPLFRTWHPHVYSAAPKSPTPHSIADILGWGARARSEEPLNLTTRPPDAHNHTGKCRRERGGQGREQDGSVLKV